MKTYQQIQQEIEALQKQAEQAKAAEVAGVVSRIKEAIAVYGLTAKDLGLSAVRAPAANKGHTASTKRRGRPASAGKPKYRDDAGNIWGGRGPRPTWLRTALAAGKSLEDFAIK